MKEKEIVIIGCGMHKFGRFPEESYAEIGREAVRMALQDAGIGWKDIQAAYCSTMYLPATSGARIMRPLGATGIPICDVEAACASGGVAIRQAMNGLGSGDRHPGGDRGRSTAVRHSGEQLPRPVRGSARSNVPQACARRAPGVDC